MINNHRRQNIDNFKGGQLRSAFEQASNKLVSCRDCIKCCETGIVYVMLEEKERLRSIGVPLIEIDGVHFIKRKRDGSCPMLDKENKRCTIYENRPMCCRAFPLDIFSRRNKLEWAVYTYCPIDRVIPTIEKNGKPEIDLEVITFLTASLEQHLSEKVLKFLAKEDKVVAQVEILDDYSDNYEILGPVLKKWSCNLYNLTT
jgi:Fe-S-cluster containining protein